MIQYVKVQAFQQGLKITVFLQPILKNKDLPYYWTEPDKSLLFNKTGDFPFLSNTNTENVQSLLLSSL